MNKKIAILGLLILSIFISGCYVSPANLQKSTIKSIEQDGNIGKVFIVQGDVLNFALDNGAKGYVHIQDNTGTINLVGRFGGLYDNPAIKFHIDYARGKLNKENGEYYLLVTDLSDVKITESFK